MPEGDTIFRTATNMRRWLEGREVTAARSSVLGVDAAPLVGTKIETIQPRAKHLLIGFSNGLTLHTHMRMTGSWHVYRAGDRWRKPAWQAKFVVECGDRIAVCFNAPVIELLEGAAVESHQSLSGLGPDVLADLDLDEVRRRANTRSASLELGVLLLDQQVVSGIGNIYRCESLFLEHHNPWKPQSAIDIEAFDRLIVTASSLMKENVQMSNDASGSPSFRTMARSFGPGGERAWVYRRTGRPCRRCGTLVESSRIGAQARDVYWCPTCQPREW